jgi:hypothetical protein
MTAELALICEGCRQPFTSAGCLWISFAEIHRASNQDAEWHEAHPAGEAVDITTFLTLPGDAVWHAHHDRCMPDEGRDSYDISVEQIRTWAGLVRWTAHLMEKNWLPVSDWDGVLREASGESPSQRIRAIAQVAA